MTEHSAEAAVVVPPRSTAVLSASAETDPTQRGRHMVGRYKRIIGDTLRSHSRLAQKTETRVPVSILNGMLDLGRRQSVRAA